MLALVEEPQRRLTKRERRLLRQQGADTLPKTPSFNIRRIKPKTDNQDRAFQAFYNDKHLFLHGTAGTGKTFIAMYLALQDLHSNQGEENRIRNFQHPHPHGNQGEVENKKENVPGVHTRHRPPEKIRGLGQ